MTKKELKSKTIDRLTRFEECWSSAYQDSSSWKSFSGNWSNPNGREPSWNLFLQYVGDVVSVFKSHLAELEEYSPGMSDQLQWAHRIKEGYLDLMPSRTSYNKDLFTVIRNRIIESIAMVSEYEDLDFDIDTSDVRSNSQRTVNNYLSSMGLEARATNFYHIDGTTSTAIQNPCSVFIARCAALWEPTYVHELMHVNSDGFPNQTLDEGFTDLVTCDAQLLASGRSIDDLKSLDEYVVANTRIATDGIQHFVTYSTYELVSLFAFALTKAIGKESLVREYFRHGEGMNGRRQDWEALLCAELTPFKEVESAPGYMRLTRDQLRDKGYCNLTLLDELVEHTSTMDANGTISY
ncbi:hypothetical protein KY366_05880 [Candidatus Woesearchaeota archaeon]|nr:hypothetical protein [Candidatus Woesearchaeota archaeon]